MYSFGYTGCRSFAFPILTANDLLYICEVLEKYYKSPRFFSEKEIEKFKLDFGYDISKIEYTAKEEIDFSNASEREFLLNNGLPKISARFFA